jgi:hypothetical protein
MQVFASEFNFENLLEGAYVRVGPSLVVSNITLFCHEPSPPLTGEITFPLMGVSFKDLNGTYTSMDGQESLLCPNTYRGPVLVFHWGTKELQGAGLRKRQVRACGCPRQRIKFLFFRATQPLRKSIRWCLHVCVLVRVTV